MAKVKIQGNASGTGVLTVTAPNTSTDRTITLPDATGTLATTADVPAAVGGATGVDFNDNVKARFGTGNDLEIYHDASNTYINENGTGDLIIKGTSLKLRSSGNEDFVVCTADGSVAIRHNDAVKLETTSGGITVTGEITTAADSKLQSTTGYMQVIAEDTLYLKCDSDSGGGESIVFHHGSQLVMQMQNNKTIDTYGSNSNWQRMMYAGGTGTQYYHSFRLSNNTQVGYISTNGSSTSYNTSSDYRLKENVDYTWDATTRLKQLKPARFNWIADETNTLVDGFIAHEVENIVPEAVTGEKDAMEAAVLYKKGDDIPEGKSVGDVKFAEQISPQSIDQAKLVPLLVKTIQELEARITALES